MKTILLSLILISFKSNAGPSDTCQKRLQNKTTEMNVITSNIANINTTRTPEGGPYKKKELICENQNCEIIAHEYFFSEYMPDHPDALETGFVIFPKINLEEENAAMVSATREYEEIITDCGASRRNPRSF